LTPRIFAKLILAILGVLLVALLAADLLTTRVAERSYYFSLTDDLAARLRLMALLIDERRFPLDKGGFASAARAAGGRLTLVSPRGEVLLDSEANPSEMENHAARPEIQQAMGGRVGSSIRQSPTLGMAFLYVSTPVRDGVLRIAVPDVDVRRRVVAVRRQMLAAFCLAFLPGLVLAALLARYVAGRLEALGRQLNDTGAKLEASIQDLETKRMELEKQERARKDFLINVSHELRTPLASIQGYTETLLDGALEDSRNNVTFLQIIRQNSERLARLIADLLALSSLEMKTQRFQFAPYRVNRLLADGVDLVRPLAKKKNIQLLLEPATEQAEVFCDLEAARQILSNLLDNAVKYTPEGGEIRLGAAPASDGFVEFFVRDTGIGIPPDDLPRLFERFYRADKARSRELGGTGLGLSIVKHLVRAQGGDVRVSSRLREGSVFYFTLPVNAMQMTEPASVPTQFPYS
jgi:two-component system phosphate regulon sensor histidine kinase PhoR